MYFSTTSSVYVYCLSMSLCTAVLAEWGPNRNKFRTFKISFRESKNCTPKLIKKKQKTKKTIPDHHLVCMNLAKFCHKSDNLYVHVQ